MPALIDCRMFKTKCVKYDHTEDLLGGVYLAIHLREKQKKNQKLTNCNRKAIICRLRKTMTQEYCLEENSLKTFDLKKYDLEKI